MTEITKPQDLIALLRTFIGDTQIVRAAREAADMIEQQATLIAVLELQVSGERGQKEIWEARAKEWCERATADSAMAKDAERYRFLRETLHDAKAGGGVEVNDALQVYEQPEPGEEVRLYWYQDTPVGFYESKAATLDEAIDAAIAASEPKNTGN